MSEKNPTQKTVYTRSPVTFAAVWLGLPLVLVITLDLIFRYLGW